MRRVNHCRPHQEVAVEKANNEQILNFTQSQEDADRLLRGDITTSETRPLPQVWKRKKTALLVLLWRVPIQMKEGLRLQKSKEG
ncbi:unnamed protein product [Linum trigynum]|uniref:Uncharacterized protein n=1 Tax=Linum trigynum TaxID=586398 RepID=A0AAV2DYK5_9ROSI